MAEHFAAEHEVLLIHPAGETRLRGVASELRKDVPGLRVLGIRSVGEGQASIPNLSRKNVNTMFDALDTFAPDVVHAHEPASLGLMAQVWAAMNGVPFVYTAHVLPTKALDFGIAEMARFLSNPWTESVTRRVMGEFLHNCDAIIALNGSAAADIAQTGYRGQLFAIPNARDVEALGTCSIADTGAPTRVLTFVGAISQRKNQSYLLKVLRRLPRHNYRLQLVGDALDPGYSKELCAWAEAEGLDNVVWTGAVPYAEIPDVLARTHVFVSASKMEVQSLAVIEALASGTPVVGLSNETIDELVDESVGGWLDQDASPEAFAQRVREVCELPNAEYVQLCTNARLRVAHLGWSTVRAQTVAAYQMLLDARSEVDPSKSVAEAQISAIVARIPSPEVRGIVFERLTRLNQSLQGRIRPHSRLGLLAMAAHSKQVSGTTWLYVGATRAASSLVGGVTRLTRN
jgi:glycosyltransferase involved in cell wall biosynthesis